MKAGSILSAIISISLAVQHVACAQDTGECAFNKQATDSKGDPKTAQLEEFTVNNAGQQEATNFGYETLVQTAMLISARIHTISILISKATRKQHGFPESWTRWSYALRRLYDA